MAYNKSNIHTKETVFKNPNSSATASKFKAVLVKDLLQSFEKPNSIIATDSTQKNKANTSKIAAYQKKHNFEKYNCQKLLNNGGSSQKCTSGSSQMANDVYHVNKSVIQESQKTGSDKISKSAKKVMRDKLTMTSPYCSDKSNPQSFLNTNNSKSVSSKMQNLNINSVPCRLKRMQFSNNSASKANFDVTNMIGIVQNVVTQLKTFLEQSVQAHEEQASKLKHILNSVNEISNAINQSYSNNNNFSACDKEDSGQKETAGTTDSSDLNTNLNLSSPSIVSEESSKSPERAKETLPIPLIKLVLNNDSNQEAELLSEDHIDLFSEAANKRQIDYMSITNPKTPKTLKAPRRRTFAAESSRSQGRRRSLSTPSESDLDATQGSFTMLERKLNIVHKKLPTSSLPSSPMKVSPSTPSFAMQWDRRSKRPLKEYLALKMKSTFLVTPDVNWFQSRLESADTGGDLYSELGSPKSILRP